MKKYFYKLPYIFVQEEKIFPSLSALLSKIAKKHDSVAAGMYINIAKHIATL